MVDVRRAGSEPTRQNPPKLESRHCAAAQSCMLRLTRAPRPLATDYVPMIAKAILDHGAPLLNRTKGFLIGNPGINSDWYYNVNEFAYITCNGRVGSNRMLTSSTSWWLACQPGVCPSQAHLLLTLLACSPCSHPRPAMRADVWSHPDCVADCVIAMYADVWSHSDCVVDCVIATYADGWVSSRLRG